MNKSKGDVDRAFSVLARSDSRTIAEAGLRLRLQAEAEPNVNYYNMTFINKFARTFVIEESECEV